MQAIRLTNCRQKLSGGGVHARLHDDDDVHPRDDDGHQQGCDGAPQHDIAPLLRDDGANVRPHDDDAHLRDDGGARPRGGDGALLRGGAQTLFCC